MSSPDDPRPEAEGEDEVSPAIDAEIERTAADDDLETAAAAGPGASDTAADRGEIAAPGAPGELRSDDDGAPAPEAAEKPAPVAAPEEEVAAPSPAEADASAPEQPPETPDAQAKQEGVEAEAAEQDKEATAAEASAVNTQAEQPDQAVEPEAEPAEVDEQRQALLDALTEALGEGGVLDSAIAPGVDLWVRVPVERWEDAGRACRDKLGMTHFGFVSAIDWMPSPYGRGEEVTESPGETTSPKAAEPGVTGGETRFQLLARLQRPGTGLGIHLKADVPDGTAVPTWTTIFLGADWHERECHEMFGIVFAGHPNLVNIYLPTDFEGHPLRKDFPLVSRMVKPWPGLVDVEAMPGEPEGDAEEEGATA